MVDLRERIFESLEAHLKGVSLFHKANVEIYLNNPVGIGEHSDILTAIEVELGKMAEATEKLDVLYREFD